VTQILFARHGETEWNAVLRVQGWTDTPLSARGRAQAAALAERLAGLPLQAVYASDLSRAVETAQPAAEKSGLEVQTLPGLRERRFGDWEGLTQADLERDHAAPWHRFHVRRDLDAPVPGGETWAEVGARVRAALAHILAAHPGRDEAVLVVGHGGSGRTLLLEALQAPLTTLLCLHLDNASVSRLHFRAPGDSRVSLLNDTGHLDALGDAGESQ